MLCITNYSQSKKNKDIESIKSMCGCFKIDFNFSETFVFSNKSLNHLLKSFKLLPINISNYCSFSLSRFSV